MESSFRTRALRQLHAMMVGSSLYATPIEFTDSAYAAVLVPLADRKHRCRTRGIAVRRATDVLGPSRRNHASVGSSMSLIPRLLLGTAKSVGQAVMGESL